MTGEETQVNSYPKEGVLKSFGETHQIWVTLKANSTYTFNSIYAFLKRKGKDIEYCRCQIGLRLKKRRHKHLNGVAFDIKSPREIVIFLKPDPTRRGKYMYAIQLFKSEIDNTTTISIRLHGHDPSTKVEKKRDLLERIEEVERLLQEISTKEIDWSKVEIKVKKLELAIRYDEQLERKVAKFLQKIAWPDKEMRRATILREYGDGGILIYRVPLLPLIVEGEALKCDIKTYRRNLYVKPAKTLFDHPKLELSVYNFDFEKFNSTLTEMKKVLIGLVKKLKLEAHIMGLLEEDRYKGIPPLPNYENVIEHMISKEKAFIAFSEARNMEDFEIKVEAVTRTLRRRIRELNKDIIKQLLEKARREGYVKVSSNVKKALGAKRDTTALRRLQELTERLKLLGEDFKVRTRYTTDIIGQVFMHIFLCKSGYDPPPIV